MELELKQWFVKRNRFGSIYVEGEIERESEKAVLFSGKALIKPSNICCACGRLLTDPVSIELGIGPICAGIDQRDTMTQEEKDEYIKVFTKEHPIKGWIPKSVIVNQEVLKELKTEDKSSSEPQDDVVAIIHNNHICVKSKYEYAELCRQIVGGRWNKEKKFWYYPLTESTALQVVKVFEPVQNKKIQQEILDLANKIVNNQGIKEAEDLPDIPLTKKSPWLHQHRAFWFSKEFSGAGLLMDMGTGKTKVAVDLVANSDDKKVLIICPKNVVRVWPKEFDKHSGREFVVVPCEVHGKQTSLEEKIEIAKTAYEENENVVIAVNFESAWRNPIYQYYIDKRGKKKKRITGYTDLAGWIQSVEWDRIVIDESHRAKQHDGQIGRFVATLTNTKRKNILTGTLMPHSPMDVFAQYRFLDHNVFGTNFYKFRDRYAIMGGYQGKQIVGYKNQDEMHEKIYSIAYRVTKDVLDLPEEQHIVRDFELGKEARFYYNQADSELGIILGDDKVRTDIVVVQLLRMQQITSGYLPVMREWYDENDKLHKELDRVEKIDSGKAELLEEIIDGINSNEPVVVFCRFQHDLDEIKNVAEKLDRKYGEISGRKKDALDERAELKDGIQVAGVQIQAGGVGIDLTKARYGIYYSVGYSLGDYEQSLARIHRPGQTKPVVYYHLVAENTIDEAVYRNLKAKKDIINSIYTREKIDGIDDD